MNPRHLSTGITSYGGDAQIVATRAEIDRVMAELHALTVWLRDQIWFTSFEPLPEIRLALELPPILEKLEHIRNACGQAADAYFGTEAEISKELRENSPLPVQKIATGFAGIGAALGFLTETPVTAEMSGFTNGVSPPNSIGELARRLNSVAELGPGIIRIEKFREPASPVSAEAGLVAPQPARYVVYIPGTQAWGPKPDTNPLDLTSDLSAISKTGFAGSERAVALAMEQVGIKPDSKVLFVGHSQGGIVAANISTRFAGSKVLTFGAPLGQLSDRLTATTLSVEHDSDLVPKIDTKPNPLAANWVTVREKSGSLDPVAQHEMMGYVKTANEIDQSASTGAANAGLARIRGEILDFVGGPRVEGQTIDFEIQRLGDSG